MAFDKNKFFDDILENIINNKIPNIDLHLHTNWTDGIHSVKEMHDEAIKKNCSHILFSEHSRKNSGNWFNDFSSEVSKLSKNQCFSIIGTEVKVLDFDGNIDLNGRIQELSDLIMVSVHRFPGEVDSIKGEDGNLKKNNFKFEDDAIKIEYDLMCAAIDNPITDIIGHPFGMSIKRFKRKPKDTLFEEIIKKCNIKNKTFEINSRYHYNYQWLLKTCKKYNVRISLGSNAHKKEEIGEIYNLIK